VQLTPRLVLLALVLLVLPALVTALFLARNAHPAVEAGAQPGGALEGRLEPRDPTGAASIGGVELVVGGRGADGSLRELARGRSSEDGHFAIDVPPFDGRYEIRVVEGAWQSEVVPASLLGERGPCVLPLRGASQLDLAFVRRSGTPVRGGRWTITGEASRSWFSASGATLERSGTFDGARLSLVGLPPMRARILVRLDGGDRTDLVIDLAIGPNRHTVEI